MRNIKSECDMHKFNTWTFLKTLIILENIGEHACSFRHIHSRESDAYFDDTLMIDFSFWFTSFPR